MRRDAHVQTYLRGFKIDLSEVEAGILACEGVTAAVAAISQDLTGAQRLVVRLRLRRLRNSGPRCLSTIGVRAPNKGWGRLP